MENGYIDLHVHSCYSDGKRSLKYIADKATQNNVGTIAFAEHYNMSSFLPFRKLVGKQIEVIPAIEMTEISLAWLPAAIGFLLGMGFLLL